MRAVYSILLFTSAVACASPASDPPAPDPAPPPAVEFPDLPVVVPNPTPPGAMPTLTAGVIYPVVCRAECVFRAYPASLVTVTKEVVPSGETLRLRGAFIGGEKEKRFKGPATVYFVEAAGVGRVELVATPLGLKTEKEIVTKTVEVDSGQGPQPPPGPKPPEPKPPGPVTEKSPWDNAPGLRVMVLYDDSKLGNLTPQQESILTGRRVRDFLDANCVKEGVQAAYYIWRPNTDDSELSAGWRAAFARAKSKGKQWVIAANGSNWGEGPLPANPDEMLAFLTKYK